MWEQEIESNKVYPMLDAYSHNREPQEEDGSNEEKIYSRHPLKSNLVFLFNLNYPRKVGPHMCDNENHIGKLKICYPILF